MHFEHKVEDFLVWLEDNYNYNYRLIHKNHDVDHYLDTNNLRCLIRQFVKIEDQEHDS